MHSYTVQLPLLTMLSTQQFLRDFIATQELNSVESVDRYLLGAVSISV
jgi:hypothetical protein